MVDASSVQYPPRDALSRARSRKAAPSAGIDVSISVRNGVMGAAGGASRVPVPDVADQFGQFVDRAEQDPLDPSFRKPDPGGGECGGNRQVNVADGEAWPHGAQLDGDVGGRGVVHRVGEIGRRRADVAVVDERLEECVRHPRRAVAAGDDDAEPGSFRFGQFRVRERKVAPEEAEPRKMVDPPQCANGDELLEAGHVGPEGGDRDRSGSRRQGEGPRGAGASGQRA